MYCVAQFLVSMAAPAGEAAPMMEESGAEDGQAQSGAKAAAGDTDGRCNSRAAAAAGEVDAAELPEAKRRRKKKKSKDPAAAAAAADAAAAGPPVDWAAAGFSESELAACIKVGAAREVEEGG